MTLPPQITLISPTSLTRRILSWLTATRRRKILSSILATLITLTSLRFAFFKPKEVKAEWYNDDWNYRKLLTVDHNDVSGSTDFANFPIMVARTDTDLRDKAQTDADDVIFVGSDNKKLDHEIESYNSSTGEIVAWVRIPTLYATEATTFYMYYGSPSAVNSENAAGVWNNYSAVWHLSETSGTRSDSTPNANNLTDNNTVTTNPGKAGTAAQFTRTNSEYLSITETTSLDVGDQDFMVSGWVYLDSEPTFVAFGEQSASGAQTWFAERTNASDTLSFAVRNGSDTANDSQGCTSFGTITTGTWYYFVGWHDSVNNQLGCRINTSTDTRSYLDGVNNTASPIELGRLNTGAPSYWDGRIDEFRFQKSIRSGDWLTTEYNNMNDNSGFFSSVGSEEKGPGPISWWKFDEGQGTSAQDSASGNNDGSISGASWKPDDLCLSEKCLFFDGTDDVVTVTNANSIDFDLGLSGGFTIQTWVRVNSDGENSTGEIFDKGTGTYLRIDTEGGDALADLEANLDLVTTDANVNITNGITLNRWHHVAVVHDGSNTITVYIDGANRGSNTGSGGKSSDANNLLIGGDTANNFHGFIDEFKVYDEARTAEEIKSDFLKLAGLHGSSSSFGDTKAYLSDGLAGYWKLDESSGNASDSSGNGITLTNNGTTTFVGAKFGRGSEHVPASTQYFSTATTIQGAKSVSFWVNPDSTTNYYVSLHSGAYITSSSGTISATGFTNPKIFVNGVETTTIAANSWQLVAVSSDQAITANQIYVGRQGTNYFDGTIDDVRIYNRALSPAEVSSLYNLGPGPVAYWKLDDNTGSTANDSSGNGNNSQTFTGSPTWTNGQYGSALDIGDNEVIRVTETTSTDLGIGTSSESITVTAWIKTTTDHTGNGTVIAKNDGTGAYPFHLYLDSSEGPCFAISDGTNSPSVCENATLNDGQWYFVAGIRDTVADTIGIFLSNRITDFATDTTTAALANNDDVSIGNSGTSYTANDLNGTIDDVKIYNYARNENQLREDLEAGHSAGAQVSIHSYWKIDEGARIAETAVTRDSVGGRNGSMSSDRWTANGKFGSAFDGNGTDYISVAHFGSLSFLATQSFTWGFWLKSDSATNPSGNEYILNKSLSSATQEPGYAMYVNSSGQICFAIDDDSTWDPDVSVCTTEDFYDTNWHHLVGVRSVADDKLYIYVDGHLRGSATDTTTATLENTRQMYFADRDGTDNGDELNADLDEIMVFTSQLTSEQVRTLYNRNSVASFGMLSTDHSGNPSDALDDAYCPPGNTRQDCIPIGHWPFSENDGQLLRNVSPGGGQSGKFGTSNGVESVDPAWASGKDGRAAVEFDGVDDLVSMENDVDLNIVDGMDVTLSAWFYRDTFTASHALITKKQNASSRQGWMLYIDGTADDIRFWIEDAEADDYIMNGTTAITSPGWHHVIVVFDEDSDANSTIYLDGFVDKEGSTGTIANIGTATNNNIFEVGKTDGGTDIPFDGKIFDVRFYDYAVTPEEAAWIYNRGGPVGWWKLDENTGSTAYDLSGKSNNGTITGATYANGKRNFALDFDGIDDKVNLQSPTLLDNVFDGGGTITMWVNLRSDGESSLGQLIEKTAWRLQAEQESAGAVKLNFVYQFSTQNGSWTTTNRELSLNSWNHIALTYDNSNTSNLPTIFINGKSVATSNNTPSGTKISDDTNNLDIGNNSGQSRTTDGLIDDIQIFNYRLTAQQVLTLYNSGAVFFGPLEGAP